MKLSAKGAELEKEIKVRAAEAERVKALEESCLEEELDARL